MDNYNKVQLKDHLDFPDEVKHIINTKQYDKVRDYINFDLCIMMRDSLLSTLLNDNNYGVIKYVINNMHSINCVDDYGWSLIHYLSAAYKNDIKLVNYFFEKYHLDLQLSDYYDEKPIHTACESGTFEMVKFLVKNGADLESETNDNRRPIHFVFQRDDDGDDDLLLFEIFKFLADKGADLESKDDRHCTPLHLACQYESVATIEFLVKSGVNLEVTSHSGWRPIHVVCYYSSKIETIKYILDQNVILDTRINSFNGNDSDFDIIDLLMKNDNLTPENKSEILHIILRKICTAMYNF